MSQELWIYDVIGEGFFESGVTDKSVRKELRGMDSEGPLSVRINSPGGSVSHAVAIKTMLDQWQGPVSVQIDGLAASAASYIAMAGENTTIAEGSTFMIHDPWSSVVGNSSELRKCADFLDKLGESIQKAYSRKSGMAMEDIAEMMSEETWLDASEAVNHGFVDSLIEEHQAAAFVVPESMGFKNVPQALKVQKSQQRSNNDRAKLQRQLELAKIVA